MRPLPHTTPDRALEGIEQLRALFPEAVTESDKGPAVDFDLLRQRLSPALVEGPAERYRLEWPGKRAAIHEANAPTAATLRPVRKRSKAFDSTQNLYIEGDNLEALKLLRQSYAGQVKMIYIDPPYNTGHDFVYNDAFARSKEAELAAAGRLDEDGRRTIAAAALKENGEANGRFHSDWLSMMWPRLQLAKDLLAQDGVLFISIDDHEAHNLRKLCDEIFGEQNLVNTFCWINNLKGRQISTYGAATTHETILCYARDKESLQQVWTGPITWLKAHMPTAYRNKEYSVLSDDKGSYVLKNELYNSNSTFNEVSRPTLVFNILYNPTTRDVRCSELSDKRIPIGYVMIAPHANSDGTHYWHAWRWSKDRILENHNELEFVKREDGYHVYTKVRTHDVTSIKNLITDIATGTLDLFSEPRLFQNPKPVKLIYFLASFVSSKDDIVLDFFSGSATTAHAVMALNAEDGGNRRFILVQLPEATAEDSEARKAGYATICDIGEERIRRAGAELLAKHPELEGKLDVGFRVLRVDSANLENVRVTPAAFAEAVREQGVLALGTETEQGRLALVALEDTVKKGRGEEDLLFQVMREVGLPLTCPVASRAVGGVTVWEAAGGLLSVCFAARGITEAVAEAMAEAEPKWAVFREAGFANDSVKANVGQVFKRLSPATDLRTL